MNAMLKKLNKKKSGRKGFTLMEMLIVVAIIAVLVAIAIPTFNNALKGANEATDKANIRAAYAEFQVNAMDKDLSAAPTITQGTSSANAMIQFADGGSYTLKAFKYIDMNANPWVPTNTEPTTTP